MGRYPKEPIYDAAYAVCIRLVHAADGLLYPEAGRKRLEYIDRGNVQRHLQFVLLKDKTGHRPCCWPVLRTLHNAVRNMDFSDFSNLYFHSFNFHFAS